MICDVCLNLRLSFLFYFTNATKRFVFSAENKVPHSVFYQQTLSLKRNIRNFGIYYDIYIDNLHSGLLRFQLLPADSRGGQHKLSDSGGRKALLSIKEISVFEEKKVKLNCQTGEEISGDIFLFWPVTTINTQ